MRLDFYRLVLALALFAVVVGLAACGGGEPSRGQPSASADGSDTCHELEGIYPPDTIMLTGTEEVSVAFTAWSCMGYDGHGDSEIPVVEVGTERTVTVKVHVRDGAEFDVRAQTENDQVPLEAVRIGEENAVSIEPLPDNTQEIFIRMCTRDGRCANYEARVDAS